MTMNNKPNDDQIIDWLESVRPTPGPGFHLKMARQPWAAGEHPPRKTGFTPGRVTAISGLALLLVVVLSLTSPSLEVLAQRWLQFFLPKTSDQTTVQIPISEISDPTGRFTLSVAEAEALADFTAQVPAELPIGFSFSGAAYDAERGAIVLNYMNQSGGVLRIIQSRADEEYQQIGASAEVEMVSVGGLSGEYLRGAWVIPEVESAFEAPAHDTLPLQATWNPAANSQMLRWQSGELLLEIIFAGGNESEPGYLAKEDLIALAERMH